MISDFLCKIWMIFYITYSHFCNIIWRKWSIFAKIGSKFNLMINWEFVSSICTFFIFFVGVESGHEEIYPKKKSQLESLQRIWPVFGGIWGKKFWKNKEGVQPFFARTAEGFWSKVVAPICATYFTFINSHLLMDVWQLICGCKD